MLTTPTDLQSDNEVMTLGNFFSEIVLSRVLKGNKIVISVVVTAITYVTKLRQRATVSKYRAVRARSSRIKSLQESPNDPRQSLGQCWNVERVDLCHKKWPPNKGLCLRKPLALVWIVSVWRISLRPWNFIPVNERVFLSVESVRTSLCRLVCKHAAIVYGISQSGSSSTSSTVPRSGCI